jgi:hypothetical protein
VANLQQTTAAASSTSRFANDHYSFNGSQTVFNRPEIISNAAKRDQLGDQLGNDCDERRFLAPVQQLTDWTVQGGRAGKGKAHL